MLRGFAEQLGDRIGRITPAGVITEFPVPNAFSAPFGIAAGPDGNLWFAEAGAPRIGRITPATHAEIAVYRRTTGEWFIRRARDRGLTQVAWGGPGLDVPVPGDYDGDGRTDLAVFRTTTAEWFILRSSDGVLRQVTFGGPGLDVPVPGDYDADGKADVAVFRKTTAEWFIVRSSDGAGPVLSRAW
jgi:hypothetical protein